MTKATKKAPSKSAKKPVQPKAKPAVAAKRLVPGGASVVLSKSATAQSLPLAERPLSHDFRVEKDALVVPWGDNIPELSRRVGGAFTADGSYIEESTCYRFENGPVTEKPDYDQDAPVDEIEGRFLYGGLLYGHFGHFLCESTARLWALAQDRGLDGVVWLPKVRLGHPFKLVKPYVPFMAALGYPDLKLVAPQANMRFEEIVFAEQGFGIGSLASGRPDYRDFMRGKLGADIAAEGPEKLYISRSDLPTKRGSVLLESQIEAQMQAEGYDIFHPEHHAIEVQLARYKAARAIVGLDGSALHLAAMVLRPEARVAIINRGPSQNIDDYILQFQSFAGIRPTRVEAISAFWFTEGKRVVKRETHALLDLPAVGRALAEAGMISRADWPEADPDALAREIASRAERLGAPLARYEL